MTRSITRFGWTRGPVLVAAVGSLLIGFFAGPAGAVVNTAPATNVPYLTGTDNYVYAADNVNGVTYVGGVITQVFSPTDNKTFPRTSLFAYSDSNGAVVQNLALSFDGPVWGLSHSSDGKFLYVAGSFATVNGITRKGLVRITIATGQVDTGFNAKLAGRAQFVQYWNSKLIVGGNFTAAGGSPRVGLASLDPTTGTATSYINIPFSGVVASNAGPTQVRRFAINPAGTRLVAIGNFTTVGGQSHWRAVMLDLSATSASVDPWSTSILQKPCATGEPNYLWDVKFSPDGSFFAFVATGAAFSGTLCDAASRFNTTSQANQNPAWINYTGGDSMYGVAIASDAVYVTGHQRWLNNPNGRNNAGPGAVSRPGIGAIDPNSGLALSWNPTRSRGKGGKLLLLTPAGLLVGSDCAPAGIPNDLSSGSNYFNGRYHPCLALAPGH